MRPKARSPVLGPTLPPEALALAVSTPGELGLSTLPLSGQRSDNGAALAQIASVWIEERELCQGLLSNASARTSCASN